MLASTKHIIEYNKDYIEHNNWDKFFGNLVKSPLEPDIANVVSILSAAGIPYSTFGQSAEDFYQFLVFLQKGVMQFGRDYSGGPTSGTFLSDFLNSDNKEEVSQWAHLAKELGFKVYQTNNGAYGTYDYAIINPFLSIKTFVSQLEGEFNTASEEDFKEI